jgi:hypothetical protein
MAHATSATEREQARSRVASTVSARERPAPRTARTLAGILLLAALAACGSANAAVNPRSSADSTAVTVTLIGDSLLHQSAPYLSDALTSLGQPANVIDYSVPGSGLIDAGVDSGIGERIDQWLRSAPSGSVVVIEYSGNCIFCSVSGQQFYDQWRTALSSAVREAQDLGLRVVLVAPPAVRPDIQPRAQVASDLAEMVHSISSEYGITESDWRTAFNDADGQYQDSLVYAEPHRSPALHVVRDPDGLHFTTDGEERAAIWTAKAIVRAIR